MNKNIFLSLLAGIVIIGGGIWIYKSSTASVATPSDTKKTVNDDAKTDMTNPPTNTSMEDQKTPRAEVTETSGVKTFVIKGSSFAFAPSSITVKKGDRVKITLDNTSGFHDLKIDEFDVATKKIQGGQQDSIEFTADKTGSFEYYCSIGQHRQMGMKGTLIVE